MLALIICALVSGTAQAGLRLSAGLSVDARLENQVNPSGNGLNSVGQMFVSARSARWSGLLELGREARRSGSGAFQVERTTLNLNGWGRYISYENELLHGFLSAGAGVHFDDVASSLGERRDVREGQRYLMGGGLGIGLQRDYLLVELEGRMLRIQGVGGATPALILRAGIQL